MTNNKLVVLIQQVQKIRRDDAAPIKNYISECELFVLCCKLIDVLDTLFNKGQSVEDAQVMIKLFNKALLSVDVDSLESLDD